MLGRIKVNDTEILLFFTEEEVVQFNQESFDKDYCEIRKLHGGYVLFADIEDFQLEVFEIQLLSDLDNKQANELLQKQKEKEEQEEQEEKAIQLKIEAERIEREQRKQQFLDSLSPEERANWEQEREKFLSQGAWYKNGKFHREGGPAVETNPPPKVLGSEFF